MMDSVVMIYLACKFAANKNAVHGEGVWAIIFCDNPSANLDPEVKQIFGSNKVFLF